MSPMMVAKGIALFSISVLCVASPSRCIAGQTCQAEGPRSGGAMLQTVSETDAVVSKGARGEASADAKTGSAPLKGRVETMTAEVTKLKQRLAKVQADVGAPTDAGASEAAPEPLAEEPPPEEHAALVDTELTTKRKGKYLSLVETKLKGDDLKSKVATMEGDVAKLKSDTSTLENAVVGETKPSLLQKSAGSSLKSRIVSLEEETDVLRSRMTNLEHTIEG